MSKLTIYLQFASLQIDCHHKKLYFISIVVFFGYYILFAWNLFVNAYGFKDYNDVIKVDYVRIILFNITMITYQGYAVGGMMTRYTIYNRLVIMNKFVRETAEKEFLTGKEMLMILNKGSVFMEKVSDALEAIKQTSSTSWVFLLFMGVYYTVIGVYSFISYTFRKYSDDLDYIVVITSLNWGFYFLSFNIFIFFYSHKIQVEGHRFKAAAEKFSSKTNHKVIHRKIQTIHLQMYHRRPVVGSGVFVIDLKLAFELAAMCFSYILIILQNDREYY